MSKRGSNSELFAHENDALTALPQLHNYVFQVTNKKNYFGGHEIINMQPRYQGFLPFFWRRDISKGREALGTTLINIEARY